MPINVLKQKKTILIVLKHLVLTFKSRAIPNSTPPFSKKKKWNFFFDLPRYMYSKYFFEYAKTSYTTGTGVQRQQTSKIYKIPGYLILETETSGFSLF
jgi:hypothetical protein